jgi:putative multiple sugar transport system substrate-binding protein
MSGKYALIIGNSEYTDSGLAQLTAPGKDAEDFARVLQSKDICDFDDVKISINQPSSSVIEEIDEFFDEKKPDDLLILYFSGHGVKDEIGSLYLAFKNTVRSRLRSTAIKSEYIREAMDQSRSKRQVLILDCCNSGAFPQGTKAEIGGVMGMTKAFQGYGRFVLTASDATQFAWEGDKVIGETDNSLFTHFLIKGLEGEADSDGDGKITVDEIYDYTYQQISKVTPKQTPTKSSSKQEGEIILRENMRIEDIKPIALSDDLINEIEDTRPYVREIAVQKLEKILKGKNIGLARSARDALEKIVEDENTTRRVAQAATQILESIRQVEQKAEEERRRREEAERVALLKAEEERLTTEKVEAERKAREEAEKLERAKAERETAEREIAEKEALEKKQRKQIVKDTAEKPSLENGKNEVKEADSKRPAVNSFPRAFGGFGLLFIIGIFLVGVIIAVNWQPSPAIPLLTETPTLAEVLPATLTEALAVTNVPATTTTEALIMSDKLVGISMPTRISTRWISDGESMVKAFEALGYKTDLQFADDDIPNQLAQIENMVTKGANVLVIAAIDGTTLSDVLQKAHDQGVLVISYDRLITKTPNVDYYATFDNFGAGVIQGTQLVDGLGLTSGKEGPFNVELFGGSPDDTNAFYFYDGAMSVIQPYIDSGNIVIQSGQMGMVQVGTLRWLAATAQARMDNLLIAYYADKRVDGILSPYDGLSIGILSSVKGVGYCTASQPCPVVTGQDAEVDSIKSMIAGEQTYTVFKDTRLLAAQTAKMVDEALKGQTVDVNDTTTYDNLVKIVPSYLLTPVSVDITNYQKILVDSGYYTADQLK